MAGKITSTEPNFSLRVLFEGPFDATIMADSFSLVEARNMRVPKVILHPKDYASLREVSAHMFKEPDSEFKIWEADLIVSEFIPEGTIEIFGRESNFQ